MNKEYDMKRIITSTVIAVLGFCLVVGMFWFVRLELDVTTWESADRWFLASSAVLFTVGGFIFTYTYPGWPD